MDVIDIVRAERPETPALDPAARAALRARLTGEASAPAIANAHLQHVEPAHHGHAPVRWWLSVAAILLVGVCLAAVIVVATRPEAAPPVAPPPTPADPGPLYPSETVPVVESLPDPFEAGDLDAVLPPPTAVSPATTAPPSNVLPFPPLALAELPDGYSFGTVGFQGGDGGYGIVRYTRPGSTTQLHLTIRDLATDYFDELDALGRELGEFAGRTVYDDGQGGGCLPDFCSIGFLWDGGEHVSISWVEPNAGDLDAWATIDTLLPLVAAVAEDPELWVEWAGAELPPPTIALAEDDMTFPALVIADPPDGYGFNSATYDTSRRTAVVRYTSGASATELLLIIRDDTQALTEAERTGRPYVEVDGIGFALDDEGPDGCEPSRCSIGWASDGSHVSVVWVDPAGDPLDAAATPDALFALASSVTEESEFWAEFGVPAEPAASS